MKRALLIASFIIKLFPVWRGAMEVIGKKDEFGECFRTR